MMLPMGWTNKYRQIWRVVVLVLLLVAIMGPWAFDRINVPAQYSCDPYVRLEGDFCGIPMRGITVFYYIAGAFINSCVELVTRASVLTDRAGVLLSSMFLPLLVLPFVSTFLLVLLGDSPRRQVFSVVGLGLAAGVGLLVGVLMGISGSLKYFRSAWGIWLYIGVVLIALILEVSTMVAERRHKERG